MKRIFHLLVVVSLIIFVSCLCGLTGCSSKKRAWLNTPEQLRAGIRQRWLDCPVTLVAVKAELYNVNKSPILHPKLPEIRIRNFFDCSDGERAAKQHELLTIRIRLEEAVRASNASSEISPIDKGWVSNEAKRITDDYVVPAEFRYKKMPIFN